MPLPLSQSRAQLRTAQHARFDHRAIDAPRIVALWHLASLDAPTVTVTWALGFAWAEGFHVHWPVLLVLALATWAVYLCDRLLDARAAIATAADAELRERHYFHWRHRRLLAPLAFTAVGCGACIAFAVLPSVAIKCGILLAAASLAYFFFVHARHKTTRTTPSSPARAMRKEVFAALLITAGCILPSCSRFQASVTEKPAIWLFCLPCFYLAGLIWLNCWCISTWESTPAKLGERWTGAGEHRRRPPATFEAAATLALCGLVLALITPPSHLRFAELLAAGALSAMLLALLDRLRARMTPLALRAAADLALLTPLLLLLR